MPQLDTITQKEYEDWLQHPITAEYRRILALVAEMMKNDWADGVYTAADMQETVIKNVSNIGKYKGLMYAAQMDYVTFTNDRKDEE